MKRVLIIGDSHVASIYSCYKKDNVDIDLQFIAATGPVVQCFELISDKLTLKPASEMLKHNPKVTTEKYQKWYDILKDMFYIASGGSNEINLKDFNSVVIYGGSLIPIGGFKWWELVTHSEKYSMQLCSDILEDKIKSSIGYKWLDSSIDYIGDGGHIYVSLNPYLNEKGLEGEHDSMQDLTTLQSIPTNIFIRKLFPIYKRLFDKKGVIFIYPPVGLYRNDGRAVASQFKSQKLEDFSHLNPEGASLMLKKIICEVQRK